MKAQTNYPIEVADPALHYDALATFLNHFEPDPIGAADIREWDRRNVDNILRRTIVRDDGGAVIGYSVALQGPWNQPGEFYLWVGVDTQHRRQGLGQMLYDAGVEFIKSHGGKSLTSEVSEDQADGVRFAKTRGFKQVRHTFQSRVELPDFDETAFAGLVEAVQSKGIRFYTLADVADTEATRRALYDINRRVSLQDPGSNGLFPAFAEFNLGVFAAPWYRAAGQFLAADGERIVGMCAVGYFQESNSMYNMMTGVDEAYRGRGIAQALKVLALRWAKAYGAGYIRTNNNSENAPMLAINRKLGYEPQPGSYTMALTLD